jgi:molybdenum cofactor cytidylyltransferase
VKAQTIDIQECTGRILSSAIFRPGGKKLLAKGHILREEDIRVLQSEGMEQIWVAELDADEVPEDEAVCGIAGEMACGCYEIQLAPGGRANLIATENCCVLVDEELLRQVNCTSGLVIATTMNFSFATAGQRIATVKSAPFAVSKSDFEGSLNMLRARGPIMQARPARGASVAVLYCDPVNGDRARVLFESVLRQKLDRFGIRAQTNLSVLENEEHVSRGMQHLLRSRPSILLVASTTAPAGPNDVVGRAMEKIGCQIERFLAPVEPGNLLLMGYKDDIPVMSAPGCFRSLKPNVVDLLLPPMLARYRVSTWEAACLSRTAGSSPPGNRLISRRARRPKPPLRAAKQSPGETHAAHWSARRSDASWLALSAPKPHTRALRDAGL